MPADVDGDRSNLRCRATFFERKGTLRASASRRHGIAVRDDPPGAAVRTGKNPHGLGSRRIAESPAHRAATAAAPETWMTIAQVTLTAALGIATIAGGFQGWALRHATAIERVMLIVAGVAVAIRAASPMRWGFR